MLIPLQSANGKQKLLVIQKYHKQNFWVLPLGQPGWQWLPKRQLFVGGPGGHVLQEEAEWQDAAEDFSIGLDKYALQQEMNILNTEEMKMEHNIVSEKSFSGSSVL